MRDFPKAEQLEGMGSRHAHLKPIHTRHDDTMPFGETKSFFKHTLLKLTGMSEPTAQKGRCKGKPHEGVTADREYIYGKWESGNATRGYKWLSSQGW